jgi:hypothetical protein
MEVDEVRDAAEHESVEDISGRAAQYQRHAALSERAAGAVRGQKPDDHGHHREREENQNLAAPGHCRIRQEAEGHAGIAGVHQIQQARNEFADRARCGEAAHRVLGGLIGGQHTDGQKGQQPSRAPEGGSGHGRALPAIRPSRSISTSAATQRSHNVGYSALSPTCVE